MNKKYGVVLIGCGYIGETHLADISYRNNIKMIAVVDSNVARAACLAEKYHVPKYGTDYKKFIFRNDVDIVMIATYVDSHFAIMKDCISANCHVLCEKPVASSKEVGERFFDEARKSSTCVLVGHELRCNQSYQKIRELIRQDTIGQLRLIRLIQNHHAVNWKRYFRLLQDCPPVLDCGVHYMDLMQWISDEKIISVTGTGCYLDQDAPCANYNTVQVHLSGGCMGVYESGWSKHLKASNQKEFIGTRGYIRLTLKEERIFDREEGDLIEIYRSDTKTYELINCSSKYKDMYGQLQTLINRIEGVPETGITLDEARQAFLASWEAKERIEESLRYMQKGVLNG